MIVPRLPDEGTPQANAAPVGDGYQSVPMAMKIPTMVEESVTIPVREIKNWCRRCSEFKMPVISEENWAGVFLGATIGLTIAVVTGSFARHSDARLVLGLFAFMFFLVAVAFASLAAAKRKKLTDDLIILSQEMKDACASREGMT
jgi:hypothetical protein